MITKDIRRARVAWGRSKRVPLINLVDDWCARVLKLADDAGGDVDAPSAWTLDDLTGAYILRDAIEDALEATRKPGDDVPLPTIAAADALLRSFCRDDRHVLESREPEYVGTGWWWGLIPRTGPVAAEASNLQGRSGSGGGAR